MSIRLSPVKILRRKRSLAAGAIKAGLAFFVLYKVYLAVWACFH
jgi:hypothetical protein